MFNTFVQLKKCLTECRVSVIVTPDLFNRLQLGSNLILAAGTSPGTGFYVPRRYNPSHILGIIFFRTRGPH